MKVSTLQTHTISHFTQKPVKAVLFLFFKTSLCLVSDSAVPLWQRVCTAGSQGHSLQLIGAAVQLNLEGLEVWPVGWLGTPTFQHDLVEKVWTFGWSWQPVSIGNLLVNLLVAKC